MATDKKTSLLSNENVLRDVHNTVDNTILTNGFLVGAVGRKIVFTTTTTSIANDTQIIAFSTNGTPLYTYTLIYTDGTQATLMSAERTA